MSSTFTDASGVVRLQGESTGGIPAQWTVAPNGGLTITPDDDTVPALDLRMPGGTPVAIGITADVSSGAWGVGNLGTTVLPSGDQANSLFAVGAVEIGGWYDPGVDNPATTNPPLHITNWDGDDLVTVNAEGTVEVSPSNLGATDAILTISDENGDPVFEVRNDGSVHILMGTTVIADLT